VPRTSIRFMWWLVAIYCPERSMSKVVSAMVVAIWLGAMWLAGNLFLHMELIGRIAVLLVAWCLLSAPVALLVGRAMALGDRAPRPYQVVPVEVREAA
jgi:hypothetical protein